jgi:signal peptidase II
MRRGAGRWLWTIAAIFAADRGTKYLIERFTSEGFRKEVVPGFAWLVHSTNPGVAFGLLARSGSGWLSLLLIVISAATVIFLTALLLSGRAGAPATQAGLALIAGGAAGNLYDRVVRGAVTDFIELHAGALEWPAFNVADAAITVGAFLVLYDVLRGTPRAASSRG